MNRNFFFLFGAIVAVAIAALFAIDPATSGKLIPVLFLGYLANLRAPLGGTGGGTMRFTNNTGAALAAGAFAKVGDRKGFVLEAVDIGADGVLIYQTDSQGYEANKDAVAIAAGDDAYIIAATSLVTNDDGAGANERIGFFAAPAAAGDPKARVVLDAGLQSA